MFTSHRIHGSPHSSRPRSHAALIGLAAVLVLGGLLALLRPLPALALTSNGHGVGHLWKSDGASWIGTYRMDDGRLGFCLDVGKPSPIGNAYTTTATSRITGTTAEETARLAFIARGYAFTASADDAAAAQLAVWTITGLGGHTQAYYAARANDQAAAVLARANAILAEARAEATTRATGRLALLLDDRGVASVQADILAVKTNATESLVPKGTYSGRVDLLNATLPNGARSGSIANGRKVAITPDTHGAEVRIRADVRFTGLKIGPQVTVGSSPAGSQGLLYSAGGKGIATASATASAVSPRAFQPRVQTRTSAAQAVPGAQLVDHLEVGVGEGAGLLTEWGRYRSGATLAPIPVTVKSRLLGPFADKIRPADSWPSDAPTVCTVSTLISTGPGVATTPSCRIPSAGYYTWVESIDPADTPADRGRDRIRPWTSPFGTASEVTLSPASIAVQTRVADRNPGAGSCAVDELDVSGFSAPGSGPRAEVEVESLLLGPFDEPVAEGRDLSEPGAFPVAGRASTVIDSNGTFETPCLRVTEPGHYVFVFRSDGSAKDAAGHQAVPAFSDYVAHSAEMLRVRQPERPTPPPTTPPVVVPPTTPPATPPVVVPSTPPVTTPPVRPRPTRSAPPALAFTGSSGAAGILAVGGAAVAVGALALAGRALVRRRRGGEQA